MARTRGIPIPCKQDTDAPQWEPEPLELPLYIPVDRRAPQTSGDEAQKRSSRVIVIDLA